MSTNPSVAIIIVNWNGREITDECLCSLQDLEYPDYHIMLVDNGSTDGSADFFEKEYPTVQVLALDSNTGFTGGNNAGIQKALDEGFDYVLLLNNDTIVEDRNFLSEMITECEHNAEIGMACPTIFYDDPPGRVWYSGAWLSLWRGWGHYHQLPDTDKPTETGYTTGCCLLVKAETIRAIGLLNGAYFLTVEDVEWSARAHKHGWKTVYIPGAAINHKDSVSSRSQGEGTYSPLRIYYNSRNSIWFIREYATPFQKNVVWPLRLGLHFLYQASAYALLGRWHKLGAIYRGYKDGVSTPERIFKNGR